LPQFTSERPKTAVVGSDRENSQAAELRVKPPRKQKPLDHAWSARVSGEASASAMCLGGAERIVPHFRGRFSVLHAEKAEYRA